MRTRTPTRTRARVSHPSPLAPRTADLLLEIGTEELPAAYLDGVIRQLREEAGRLLRERHLEFAAVEGFGTPRRLVLFVWTLSGVQRNPPEEIRGPSKQAAFDVAGQPTSALQGFLKAKGGRLSDIRVTQTEKGEYVYLGKPERRVPTEQALPAILQELVVRLRFPKTMRWDGDGLRFARPVRWLLALYGKTVIRFSAGGLTSQRTTRVGGPKRPKTVRVKDAADYIARMTRQGIVLDPKVRREQIEALLSTAAKQHRGAVAPEAVEHGLLDEVSALVEQPVALVGQFDAKFSERLPRELLLASQAKYQRVFALQHASGRILPRFVAILDGTPRKLSSVRNVYEHILNARLTDSLLFWNQDHRALPLAKMAERLKDVTFHEKLGSMAEKTKRLEALARVLAETWQLDETSSRQLIRAAALAKADLVTAVVREFPTLQGVIGKYYARDSGEEEPVQRAIEQHYWLHEVTSEEPRQPAAKIPAENVSFGLAIADKFDTLASYFGLGIEPTGDADPFGLRRCAQGIVEAAYLARMPLPLSELCETRAAFPPFDRMLEPDRQRSASRIAEYIRERLFSFSMFSGGPSRELINAILSSSPDDLADVIERILQLSQLEALYKSHSDQRLVKAAKVIERTRNILKGAQARQAEVDPGRLQEPLERKLWELYQSNKDRLLQLIQNKSYAEATEVYGEVFFEPLHEFFEHVMVNVNDEAIQQNRLALMNTINTLYTERVADLSTLGLLQSRATITESVPTK